MSIRFHCRCGREFRVPDSAAGKKAKCLDCGAALTVPAGHRPPRPAEPPAGDVPVARLVPEEDIPVATIVPERPVRRHVRPRHGRGYVRSVQAAGVICFVVMAAVVIDMIITLARARHAGAMGMDMIHAVWVPLLVIGFFVTAAAMKGSRLCIGILIGGAVRGMFLNGPGLLATPAIMSSLAGGERIAFMIAGCAALALGAVYIGMLLIARQTRKHLAGHGGTVAGGAVIGFIFGGAVALTALPDPSLMLTRMMARPDAHIAVARALDAPELISKADKDRIRSTVKSNMADIMSALYAYMNDHINYLPDDLGELVSEDCPAEKFICPGSGHSAPKVNKKTGRFEGPVDIIYLLRRYHLYDLPKDMDELGLLIVCYSDPNCHFGEGAVVIHPPVPGLDPVLRWLDKEDLDLRLDDTRNWISRHKPRPPIKVEKSD
ncbi:MAG: hypothetical protein WBF17_03025 [Phycisphaerae bacterium]